MISITTQSQTIIPHYYQTWKNIKTTATFVGKDLHGGVLDNETVWHQKLCHRNFKLTFGTDHKPSVLGMWKYISSKQVYLLSITHNNQQTKHVKYVISDKIICESVTVSNIYHNDIYMTRSKIPINHLRQFEPRRRVDEKQGWRRRHHCNFQHTLTPLSVRGSSQVGSSWGITIYTGNVPYNVPRLVDWARARGLPAQLQTQPQ